MAEIYEETELDLFAEEWERERAAGYPVIERLREEALHHPINRVEERLRGGA